MTIGLLVAIALALAGCQTTGGSFCDSARAIRPAAEEINVMSDQTRRQILAHNKTLQAECGVTP